MDDRGDQPVRRVGAPEAVARRVQAIQKGSQTGGHFGLEKKLETPLGGVVGPVQLDHPAEGARPVSVDLDFTCQSGHVRFLLYLFPRLHRLGERRGQDQPFKE